MVWHYYRRSMYEQVPLENFHRKFIREVIVLGQTFEPWDPLFDERTVLFPSQFYNGGLHEQALTFDFHNARRRIEEMKESKVSHKWHDRFWVEARKRGYKTFKGGMPDGALEKDGKFLFVEIKGFSDKLRSNQVECHKILRSLGFDVVIARPDFFNSID